MNELAALLAKIAAAFAEINARLDRIEAQRAAEREWLAIIAASGCRDIPAEPRWLQ
jgi:hypothetical protein